MKSPCIFLLWAVWAVGAVAQPAPESLYFVDIAYSGAAAGGDLANRFGFVNTIGAQVGFKHRSNWYAHAGASYLFAGPVRETGILGGLRTPSGFVIADDGTVQELVFQGTGLVVPVMAGRILGTRRNPNSGLYAEVGGQFLQHRIDIRTIGSSEVSALSAERRKGYDRFTQGWGLRQGLGYRHVGARRYLNFSVGLTAAQSLTRSSRTINVDTGLRDDLQRRDLLWGVLASWTVPLHRVQVGDISY